MLKLFAIAAIALTGTPAFAGQTSSPAPAVRVAVADLDLRTPAGVERLDRRLAAAIRRACPTHAAAGVRAVYDCLAAATQTAHQGRSRLLGDATIQLAAAAH